MSIEEALATELLGNAGVAALTGARIYPQVAPQNTAGPYITYEVIAKRPVHDLGGNGGGSGGMTVARVSFVCYGASYAAAKALAAAVAGALDNRRGTVQGTEIGALLSESEADAGFDDQTRMHAVAVDFRVLYA